MRIDSSELTFQSSYQAYSRTETSERLAIASRSPGRLSTSSSQSLAAQTQVSISSAARFSLQMEGAGATAAMGALSDGSGADSDDPVVTMLRTMIEMMTGQTMRVFSSADMSPVTSVPSLTAPASASVSAPARGGSALAYDAHYLHEEMEKMNFSAEGVIRTSDGQEIRFKLELAMERSYREESSVSVRMAETVAPAAPARKDPLVVNFAGTAAQLSNRFIQFDLNGDGKSDLLPGLKSGSAYLVLDRNNNGRIDDGSELFGPATDKGFAELALLDSDGNHWIDEADPLFSRLALWNPATDGQDAPLRKLTDSGIGALALARVPTAFALRGQGNEDLGQLKETGLYLNDDGSAGTLQEIDLTAQQPAG